MLDAWDLVREIGLPVLTGGLGVTGTMMTLRSRERSDAQTREITQGQAQLSFDASQAQTLTDRFRALMDGYEHRIEELVADLKEYREREKGLERQVVILKTICSGCDKYRTYMQDHPNAFPTST